MRQTSPRHCAAGAIGFTRLQKRTGDENWQSTIQICTTAQGRLQTLVLLAKWKWLKLLACGRLNLPKLISKQWETRLSPLEKEQFHAGPINWSVAAGEHSSRVALSERIPLMGPLPNRLTILCSIAELQGDVHRWELEL